MRFLLAFLLSVASCNEKSECPEPVVCNVATDKEAELGRMLAWQAGQIAKLTLDAAKVKEANERCPSPDCHCAPSDAWNKKHKHHG